MKGLIKNEKIKQQVTKNLTKGGSSNDYFMNLRQEALIFFPLEV